jgi:hypothetical protein
MRRLSRSLNFPAFRKISDKQPEPGCLSSGQREYSFYQNPRVDPSRNFGLRSFAKIIR